MASQTETFQGTTREASDQFTAWKIANPDKNIISKYEENSLQDENGNPIDQGKCVITITF